MFIVQITTQQILHCCIRSGNVHNALILTITSRFQYTILNIRVAINPSTYITLGTYPQHKYSALRNDQYYKYNYRSLCFIPMYKVIEELVPSLPIDQFVKFIKPKRRRSQKEYETEIKLMCNNSKSLFIPIGKE